MLISIYENKGISYLAHELGLSLLELIDNLFLKLLYLLGKLFDNYFKLIQKGVFKFLQLF